MPWSICNNELPPISGKESIGDINSDPLLTLRRKAIDQKRKINITTLGAHFFGIALKGGHLIFKNHLCFKQHPPDERAFAVINAAAGNKPQGVEICLLVEVLIDSVNGIERCAHQKYPSCFFFSIEALESVSMARP